jgi:hypothetical protein
LQSLTNLVYIAAEGESGRDAKSLAMELSQHVQRLSALVNTLLSLPRTTSS